MSFLFLALAAALLASGCVGPPSPGPAATPGPVQAAAVRPGFILLSPENDQAFSSNEGGVADIMLTLAASDFTLRPPGSVNRPGEGHFIFQLDQEPPQKIFSKQYGLRNVEPGAHTLQVELVNNDNSPYSPPITQTVRFVVIGPAYVPKMHGVSIQNFTYEPAELVIHRSDTVVWTHNGSAPRTVTSAGSFNSGTLTRGQNFSYTFDKPGTYDYFSVNNPGMKGKIVVTG